MNQIQLLIIDPQNDFMDIPGAALPVPGANVDMNRTADFLQAMRPMVSDIVLTLDSHASFGIERTTFWVDERGRSMTPFTQIKAQDMERGTYVPRFQRFRVETLTYLQTLESAGEHALIVWPIHCVVGTWGHNLHERLSQEIADWESATGSACVKVLKGQNPMTEQYSAFRAEVPRKDDARTENNAQLMARLEQGPEWLVVAGEASSHCVAASCEDMLAQLSADRLQRMIILSDCMSPVSGFELTARVLLEKARSKGVHVLTSQEAVTRLAMGIM